MMRRALACLALTLLLLAAACGSSKSATPADAAPPVVCDEGYAAVAGACFPKYDECANGEVPKIGGGCLRVGVPDDGCAEGFTHDASQGCVATLPKDACAKGTMAVPGETACREIAPCGTGTWGAIPVDGDTLYVDASYAGGGSDGSSGKPFVTIGAAVAAATGSKNAIVAIAAGSYVEAVVIDKAMRLYGRCPSMVELKGPGGEKTAVDVKAPAELHGLAVTGPGYGVLVENATTVRIDQLWIHDTGDRGLDLEGDLEATVSATLVERTKLVGIVVIGAKATISKTVVRDVVAFGGKLGMGVLVEDYASSGVRGELDLKASLVQRTVDSAVASLGSIARVDGCALFDIKGGDVPTGAGLAAQDRASTKNVAELTAKRTVIERAMGAAVTVLGGSTTSLDRVTIRDTLPSKDGLAGEGIEVNASCTLTMSDSIVERSTTVGVNVVGGTATIERSIVRDTGPRASDSRFGMGVVVSPDAALNPGTLTLRDCVVEKSRAVGVAGYGSTVVVERIAIRDTSPEVSSALFGDGMLLVAAAGPGTDLLPATLSLEASVIRKSARAGLNVQGASVTLHAVELTCNAFDLEVGRRYAALKSGAWQEHDYTLEDRGGNVCGCADARAACQALGDELEPLSGFSPGS